MREAFLDEDRWAHQPLAIAAITTRLRVGGRATLLSACGSGKSKIAALVARDLVPDGSVLVTVPTLDLAGQMLGVFRDVGGSGRLVAVCSDKEILAGRTDELGGLVTTRPEQVAAAAAEPGRVTVVCTYASLPTVIAAHDRHGLGPWCLVVVDEAHRTAGRAGRTWSQVHDDVLIPTKRRLYMTATPKILTGDEESVSMDDQKTYGPVAFTLPTGKAIARGLLADWQLLVAFCDDPALLTAAEHLQVGRVALAPHVLAQQIAVLRAASEHGIRALLTYHNRVESARSWAVTLPQTWELMPPQLRPATVSARHVHGGQDPQLRRSILDELRAADATQLRVVTNARVLTEGVDIPAVDGVAMIEPRSSIIDIVQIIGRAMRTGGDRQKVAKIIVPLMLSPGESAEAALDGSSFQALWRVLVALRAHDDRLQQSLDAARAHLGEESVTRSSTLGTAPGWLSLTGDRVPEGFAEAVWLKAVRAATSTWTEFYGAARAYREQHGHINIDYDYCTEDGLALGRWVSAQFQSRWKDLSEQRRELLRQLGEYETEKQRRQRKGLAAVRAWLAEHPEGLHDIPVPWTHDGVILQRFVADRRDDRRARRLDPDLDAALITEDPAWYLAHPQKMVRVCRAFYREHGHLLPDPDYRTDRGLDPYSWLEDCRNRYAVGRLNAQTHHALVRLGMIWNRRDAQLMRGVLAARRHAQAHGNLDVPADHVCSDGYRLGRFMKQQMTSRQQGTIRVWCSTALTQIDPSWYKIRSKAQRREHKLRLAAAYVKVHGHLPRPKPAPPSPAPEGEDFRPWLREQRHHARKGRIHPDILTGLNALDPNWRDTPRRNESGPPIRIDRARSDPARHERGEP